MEWYWLLALFLFTLLLFMATGMPVAFGFLIADAIFMFIYWSGQAGLDQFVQSLFTSVASFTLLPIPLFILMGEVMFRSGIAPRMMEALDKMMGRLPGRLGLLAVGGGTIFATLTGSSVASVAMLGSVLVPEMEKRGYKKTMSLGPIMGSAGLAIMIPPSNLAVLLGAVGEISVGRLLIAIVVPGVMMAVFFAAYIILRCWLQPAIAPSYEVRSVSLSEKLSGLLLYVLPLGLVVFLCIGVIFVGVATPSEAAATGALGTFVLAACYRKLNWKLVWDSVNGTVQVTIMVLMIVAGAFAFSQILAFSGVNMALSNFAANLPIAPIMIVIAMIVVSMFLGMFINMTSIIVLTVPIFVPMVQALGYDPVWFGAMYMLTIEMAGITPPFGLTMFAMKGVAPKDTTMQDIYGACLPYVALDTLALVLMLAFPAISLWLPNLMR